MKYIITLIVLFSTPAYAQMFGANHWSGFTHSRAPTVLNQRQKQRVTLYSTNGCPYCRQARNYFRANRIPYTEYNIDRSRAALHRFEALRTYGTPTFVLGKRKLVGFSVARFRQFYR